RLKIQRFNRDDNYPDTGGVHQGKTVVSSEDSAIIEWAMKTIASGKTTTLYLKPIVFAAIRRWYWTPERLKIVGMKPISSDQSARIKSDFNIEVDGYANVLDCPRCGHVYSTYEFIQQGIEEHGEEFVKTAFSLKRVAILQINPVQNTICRNCHLHFLSTGLVERGVRVFYSYDYSTSDGEAYACCNSYILEVPDLLAVQ
ncbi:MAG: hypothetical protein V7707_20630, partial [Motiliproteus sp.]